MKAFPKDITVQTMKTRHIGVESELRVNDYSMESHIVDECKKYEIVQSIGYDGGGREFRTIPIDIRSLKQVRGYRCFTDFYGALEEHTNVIRSGGTHIHISILNDDHPNMEANATAMAIAFYRQFQKISGRDSGWAYRLNYNTLKEVINYVNSDRREGRVYGGRNSMLDPTYHQTLEFRGPKGSNDHEEILAWIEFIDNVVRVCNQESIENIPFKRLLRTKRIKAYVKSLEGWRRLTDKELNQKFKGDNLRSRA